MSKQQSFALLAAIIGIGSASASADLTTTQQLAGHWTMSAAYQQLPDGSHVDDYGAKPRGELRISADGRYALQIYHATRTPYASGDLSRGAPEEYRQAVLTMSTHYGQLRVSPDGRTLIFSIVAAANAAWDGSEQTRAFQFDGKELSWQVPPRPNGDIPVSIWRKQKD